MKLNFLGQGIHELPTKSTYRILVLGASKTGKTSIVRQFLYDQFSPAHTETMDDMYRGEFEDVSYCLVIQEKIRLELLFFQFMEFCGNLNSFCFPGWLSMSFLFWPRS